MEKDKKRIREELQETLSCLDFLHIFSLFLVANDKWILHQDNIQKRKSKNVLDILLKDVLNDSHDPNKLIFSFFSYELSDVGKSVLCKGFNSTITTLRWKITKFLQWGFVFYEN